MTAPARAAGAPPAASAAPKKKPVNTKAAWRDARALMWRHRRALGVGFALMLVSRASGFLLPLSSRWLIDDVIGQKRFDLIWPLALGVAAATAVQAVTGFALSQVISVAAQRAISDMRRRVQARITRLPVRFFDDHQTGVLISRIMNDAEGIRNLVGTGSCSSWAGVQRRARPRRALLAQRAMTLVILVFLGLFGWGMAVAVQAAAPDLPRAREDPGGVTGRLNETLGGIRVVKAVRHRAARAGGVRQGGAPALPQHRQLHHRRVAHHVGRHGRRRARGRAHHRRGRPAVLRGEMTLGDLLMYVFFVGMLAAPVVGMASIGTQISEAIAGLDRIREVMQEPTELDEDAGASR
jgi:subfamily B ATP-binding cassette protein MsbA